MIAKLSGRIDSVGAHHLVVDVGGVGYLVHASSRTLARLPSQTGAPVSLLIDTQVREDQITLYGFADAAEKDWFALLLTVQGVGARVAQSLLGAVAPERLALVIAAGDRAALRQAEGVGEKLALRIVTELKDKAAKQAGGAESAGRHLRASAGDGGSAKGPGADAVSALIHLGYGRAESFGAVANVLRRMGDDAPLDGLIRESLRELTA